MPWDAGASMERLQRTLQSLRELKQRKRESNRVMFSDLLGKGMDVWKTVTEPGREEAAAKLKWGSAGSGIMELGARTNASIEQMKAAYDLDIKKMRTQAGIDWGTLDHQQQLDVEKIDKQFLQQLTLAERSENFELRKQTIDQNWARELENLRQTWETARQGAGHGYTIDEIREQAKATAASRGLSGDLLGKWESMLNLAYSGGKLQGLIVTDEMGNDRVIPGKVEQFARLLKIPPMDNPADMAYLEEVKADFLKNLAVSESKEEPPGTPSPMSAVPWEKQVKSVKDMVDKLLQSGKSTTTLANDLSLIQEAESWDKFAQSHPVFMNTRAYNAAMAQAQEAMKRIKELYSKVTAVPATVEPTQAVRKLLGLD